MSENTNITNETIDNANAMVAASATQINNANIGIPNRTKAKYIAIGSLVAVIGMGIANAMATAIQQQKAKKIIEEKSIEVKMAERNDE